MPERQIQPDLHHDSRDDRYNDNDACNDAKARHAEHRRQASTNAKPLSDTTINRDIEVIRHLLFWAADEGFLPANPIARVRMARERPARRPVMPVAEEAKLLAVCSAHMRLIVIAAIDTGMRRGELRSQLWEDIDFDRKLISVTHSKTAEGEHRLIPLTARVEQMLRAMRKPSGVIFVYDGQPIHSLKTGWAGALRRAGIPHYRFHDLRHTFNSRLADLGIIADVRKELMGHSAGGDVNSLYTHIELPTLREAIQRLDEWHAEKMRSLMSAEDSPDESLNHQPNQQEEYPDEQYPTPPA